MCEQSIILYKKCQKCQICVIYENLVCITKMDQVFSLKKLEKSGNFVSPENGHHE